MNSSSGENIQFETPSEQVPGSETVNDAKNEAQPTSQENSPSKHTSAPIVPVAPINIPIVQNPVIPADDSRTDDDNKIEAKESNPDRIERQWIDKAKSIVAQTKADPYLQKTEMSKMKAEYIKTRFNKALKTEQET